MAIDVELAGLKAAGTYRFEKDLSTLSSDNVTEGYSNLRLIVGFSKKGPFNSVQLITSASQFIKLYGNIDRSLEKRGSYFHRSALAALSAGPILCLNLLNLELDTDAHQVMHRSFSTNVCEPNANICSLPYQTLYNTDKFWYLSSDSYLDSVSKHREEEVTNNILNFTNVGNKPISILVKKATGKNIKGYEISLKEWYGAENVPEYLNGSSLVSDYMVEVYVIGGNFGPELQKRINPKTGTTYIYEDDRFSNQDSDSDYTSPYQKFASDIVYKDYYDEFGFKADKLNKFLKLPSVNVIASYVGSLIPNFTNKLNQNIWIEDIVNKDTLVTGLFCSENVELIESAYVDNNGVVDESIDIIGHNIFNNINLLNEGFFDVLSYGVSLERYKKLQTYYKNLNVEIITDEVLNNTFIDDQGTKIPINKNTKNIVIVHKNTSRDKQPKIGDLFVSYYNYDNGKYISRMEAKVIDIKPLYKYENSDLIKDSMSYMIEFSNDVFVENGSIYKISTIDDYCDRYHWTYLGGFKVSEKSMPGGETDEARNTRQNEILDMISETNDKSNLYKALIDRDYIQWRYVIDTFGHGIESECKKVYSLLCKGRQAGLAIVNVPSMKDFKKSIDPSFINDLGSVKTEYIANGGNLDNNPTKIFSLPKEENGASWAAYFYPYLKIYDLGGVKTVPPAAYVSNLYISKYNNSKPWSIVAGPKRGVISGNQVVGLEGTLIHDDREYLEPMGINPIVWENGIGVEIFANKTAKQTPVSALSSIHAREVCIYIQDNVEAILKKYNWEANTARNREEIKTLVDTFLSGVKDGDGIYDFKTVMDTTNNTTDIIDRNMGVIDIYVEVVRGLEILAQRLTVLKTGSIESGNFE